MFTALSPEVLSGAIMKELGLTNAVVSALTGIERTRLGYAIRKMQELSNDEAMNLKQTVLRLKDISIAIQPFSLSVDNVSQLQQMLHDFEGLSADVIAARIRVVFQGDGFDNL